MVGSSYEPELHPGVTFKMKDIPATLKIFSTGSITITSPRVQNVQKAVEDIYTLVYEFRKERREDDLQQFPLAERKRRRLATRLLREKQNGNACKKTAPHRPRKRIRVSEEPEENSEEETRESSDSEGEPFDIKTFKTPIEVDDEDDDDLL